MLWHPQLKRSKSSCKRGTAFRSPPVHPPCQPFQPRAGQTLGVWGLWAPTWSVHSFDGTKPHTPHTCDSYVCDMFLEPSFINHTTNNRQAPRPITYSPHAPGAIHKLQLTKARAKRKGPLSRCEKCFVTVRTAYCCRYCRPSLIPKTPTSILKRPSCILERPSYMLKRPVM